MIDLKEFERLKTTVEDLKEGNARTEGALNEVKARIKAEFGCTSLNAAKKLRTKLDTEADEAEAKFNDAFSKFEDQWKGTLADVD